MLKTGIIGHKDCFSYADIINKHPAFKLSGVFDPSFQYDTRLVPDNLPVFQGLTDLIKSSDAILVASGEKVFFPFMVQAVKYSKPLFLHSTFNLSRAEHEELCKLNAEAGELIQVRHEFAAHEAFQHFKSLTRNPLLVEIQQSVKSNNEILHALRANISAALMVTKSNVRKVTINTLASFSTVPDIINLRIDFDNGSLVKIQVNGVEKESEHRFKVFEYNEYYDFSMSGNQLFSTKEGEKKHFFKHENTAEKQIYRQLEAFFNSTLQLAGSLNSIDNELTTQNIIERVKDKLRVCFSLF